MIRMPEPETSALVLIDVQERLAPAISGIDEIIKRQKLMLSAAAELSMRVIVNEQYPDGLGHTVPELAEVIEHGYEVFEKTSFSAFGNKDFAAKLASAPVKTVVLMGIEAHVCVQQTAFDAMNCGYNVVVLSDAVGSRKESDIKTSIELMLHNGIMVTSVESFLFTMLRDAKNPSFKTVSKLLR